MTFFYKGTVLAIWCFSPLLADMQLPVPPLKNFRWEKLAISNHQYILITENSIGAQTYALHDPDCKCQSRLTEEQIAKIIQEVLRLKENQK